ncbi:ATP-binding protein [Chromobacterium alticapitis]|nr:ATP-binding protein [Chromobacterium alticapitis]
MQTPDQPSNEDKRIAALHALNILDTPPEERFDRITRLAQHIMQVPIALVSFVDAGRQWFKSHQGLDARQTGRDISFCGHAILGSDIFCVADTHEDQRFLDNPLVTGNPHIRFYAGAPLDIGGGVRLGTLCAIDRVPRQPSPEQLSALRDLAALTVDMMLMQPAVDLIRQLHDSDARLRAVLDTAADGIITIDADGGMESANLAACRIFGYEMEEIVGQPIHGLIASPGPGPTEGLQFDDKTTEVTGRRRDGSAFPLELSIREMSLQEGRAMWVAVARDISERKRMENVKNEFISTVSHELRTPLTSIHGGLNLALGMAGDGLPPKMRQLLEIASRNCDRLILLANDILDLGKIESGHLAFDFDKIDISELVQQSVKCNEGYANQNGIALRVLNTLGGAHILGDQNRLLQVLSNILSNAVKFSPRQGVVEISVLPIQDRYRIKIHDEGRGIPESFRGEIFKRFSQADKSDTREKGGAGLGLNISKAIIERHHGALDYESTMGAGTTFFFDLAAAPAPQPAIGKALICESHAGDFDALRAALAEIGMESDCAYRGDIALELLRHQPYQAILIDLPQAESQALLENIIDAPLKSRAISILMSDHIEQTYLKSIRKDGLRIHWLPGHAAAPQLTQAILSILQNQTQSRRA